MPRAVIALLILLAASSLNAKENKIEIKGVYPGMPKAEMQKKFGEGLQLNVFTIGGVECKYPVPYIEFIDDKLSSFVFVFEPESFEKVFTAVKSKYPEMKCAESVIQTNMGAKFGQISCKMEDSNGFLHLSKYVNDINTSSLLIESKAHAAEFEKKSAGNASDI